MRIIDTAELSPGGASLSPSDRNQVYCGLDSCVTLEVLEKVRTFLDPASRLIYDFERALQAPALEMMLRGILTDDLEVSRLLKLYDKRRSRLHWIVDQYAEVIWGRPLNPLSPKQLCEIFYETMNIPPYYIYVKGKKTLSANIEALTAIQQYRYARPLALAVLSIREVSKKIAVLRSGIDNDNRMRFSYNISGTNTGRFSSNKNVFGGGTNGQNITDELRRIFISGKGKKFAYLDLEQAESRVVAYLAGDEAYIRACEDGDLHTAVAADVWPDLDWQRTRAGEVDSSLPENRTLAEQKFWRHWSRRDLSKRGGHLTNYVGQPHSNAKALNITIELMSRFQRAYMTKFAGIPRMHMDTARTLQTESAITTPLGRKRIFFGRAEQDDILRKGVAYGPQSSVADILDLGMWRIWKLMRQEVQLLAQLHDAILFEYDDDPETEAAVLGRAATLMTIPVRVTDTRLRGARTRQMVIPVDIVVGWNWAKYDPEGNPGGLLKLGRRTSRLRPRQEPGALDKLLARCEAP